MAKVNARGRITLVEVVREITSDGGFKYKDFRRYMSDRRVLCKSAWHNDQDKWVCGNWTLAAKGQTMTCTPQEWRDAKVKCGWTVTVDNTNKTLGEVEQHANK